MDEPNNQTPAPSEPGGPPPVMDIKSNDTPADPPAPEAPAAVEPTPSVPESAPDAGMPAASDMPAAPVEHPVEAPHEHHSSKKMIIIMIIAIAVILAAAAILLYMMRSKPKPATDATASTATTQQQQATQPATTADVDKTSKDLDSAITSADNAKDVTSNDLSTTALGL